MPIPTDTYWNIKRLNVWFAVSAVVLMGTMGWAIFQDFNQGWRQPQRDGKVWEAALVEEKIERETTPQKEARLRELQQQIQTQEKQLQSRAGEKQQLDAQIKKLSSDQSDMEFRLNQLKANVGVAESQLQDAVTAKNTDTARKLEQQLAEPRKKLAADTEALWKKKTELTEAKEKLAALTADVDALAKQQKKFTEDADALKKKLDSLQPNNVLAKLSTQLRETPLMQFINPATRVQQIALPEVLTDMGGFTKVETVDRCMTCHVNITRKEFTEPNILAYLEEQVAASRNLKLPEQPSAKASDPAATRDKPGAIALPEFWHLWGVRVAPDQVRKPAALTRLTTLAKTVGVGKPIRVSIAGRQLDSFAYIPDPSKKDDAQSAALDPATRDIIIAEVIRAWIAYGSGRATNVNGSIGIKISESTDDKTAAGPRLVAMKYVEDLRTGMSSTLPPETLKLLTDRYRRALIAEANIARRKQGLKDLDPSPALLAHPRLDLYVDVDSPHSFEAVGCTSCHDGSGQETDFVLTAHMPRPIWVDQKTGAPVLPVQLDATKAPQEHEAGDLSSMLDAVYPEDDLVPSRVSDIHLVIAEHAKSKSETKSDVKAPPTTIPSTQPTTQASTKPAVVENRVPAEPPVEGKPVPYFDPVTGATGRAVSQMKFWEEKYEPSAPRSFELVYHEWDWPMRPPKYLQANCVRCHTDVNSIKDEAPQVFEGRSLFINNGCVNCHQMDSIPAEAAPKQPSDIRLIVANGQHKVGSDLRNITSKLSPSFINTWIWAPKSFRPSTKMPHFFMLENNSSDEELRRTRQEARSITEYLTRTASQYLQLDSTGQPIVDKAGQPMSGPLQMTPIPSSAKGSAEAGKAIFATIGCQGCHTNTAMETADKRNGKPVTLAEKWIVTDLVKSGKLGQQLEAELGKPADAKSLTARATELFDHMTYNERQLYIAENLAPDYSGNISKYADGTLKPAFQHHGPELSGVGTKLLTGRTPDQARAWLFNWVKEPRHYSEYTLMPQLRLNDQQALDLTEYLLAQKRSDDWKAELTPPDTTKLIELVGLFLRSRYSALTAQAKADDEVELTALAADALTTAINPIDAAKVQAAAMSKDEKRMVFLGKKLIGNYGCMSCHAINGTENLSSPCANLSDWGQKGVDKLDFGYLDHHKLQTLKADAKTGEPLPQSIPMVNGLSAKASHLTGAEWRTDASDGKIAEAVSAHWPEVPHSRTGWLTQKLKNTRVYDRGQELKNPDPKSDDILLRSGRPYDKLKMPTFYLGDREVDAIVTWVISNRDRLISPRLAAQTVNEQAKRIARGRQLAQKYNCVGCHIVDGNTPPVQQFYKLDEIATTAPPSLRGEGNKIQHAWLFNFIKNVEPLRPKLFDGIRMPSFSVLDEEATDIAAYFNSLSVKEAKSLDKTLLTARKYLQTQTELAMKLPEPAFANPTTMPADRAKSAVATLVQRGSAQIAVHDLKSAIDTLGRAQALAAAHHVSEQVGATTKPVADRLKDVVTALKEERVPIQISLPGEDWFTRPEFAVAAQRLRAWALENQQVFELQLDPARNKPEELARNMHVLLYKANFVSELYDAPYPFVDSPRPQLSEQRFKKGEALFYEMACLKCHVLGDPAAPGALTTPTAPNLTLAHRRLQRRWVRHWVQEPPIIQVGTAMPPFFTGQAILNEHGQSWPRAQKTERPIDQVEAEYGKTVDEQTNLLMDFVYAAGVKGYTGVQPAAATTAPASALKPAVKPEVPKVEPAKPQMETPKVEAPKPAPAPKPEAPKPAAPKPEPDKPAASSAGPAAIIGTVKLDGKAPEQKEIDMSGVKECAAHHADPVTEETVVANDKGDLKNVVIYVSGGLQQATFDAPKDPAVLNQSGCMYSPHVLPVMVGQQLAIKNSDSFLHNVHSLSQINPSFNFGQPNVDPGKVVEPLKAAETIHVKCDVHPWMSAYIVALENPYFAVSGDDGKFSIANLPPGEYTLTAWHEQLGTKEIPVKVEAGKPADVKISFAAP